MTGRLIHEKFKCTHSDTQQRDVQNQMALVVIFGILMLWLMNVVLWIMTFPIKLLNLLAHI